MKKLSLIAVAIGVCLLIGGFIYDVMFAGIPYQDPTPEMQARYDRHAGIATKTMQIGFVVSVVGTVGFVVVRLVAKKEADPATSANSGAAHRSGTL